MVVGPEIIDLMRSVLDEAWGKLPPERQHAMLKSDMALKIFGAVERGITSRDRLLATALDQPN
jgi:hypothetical protein